MKPRVVLEFQAREILGAQRRRFDHRACDCIEHEGAQLWTQDSGQRNR